MTTYNPALSIRLVWHALAASWQERLTLLALGPSSGSPAHSRISTTAGESARSQEPEPPIDLKGLKNLDPEVISQVHNRYFPDVFRYARYRLSDEVLAEDVAGETFTRLIEYAHRGKGPKTNVRGWLMRTASNLVNDYYRAHYGRPTEELQDTMPSDNPGPGLIFDISEEKKELHEALKALTEEQINVLALRFGSGLSLAETAEALGKNANAIKALQFRAIGALRRQMAPENTA